MNQNQENYLSTTMLAKSFDIQDTKSFISYLEQKKIISRDENNKLKLTSIGEELGGSYKKSESGSWIVWQKSKMILCIEEFKKENNIETHKKLNILEQTPHQKMIFNSITSMIEDKVLSVLRSTNIEDYLISLTGAAGTGKTFLTTQIAQYLSKKLKDTEKDEYLFIITAPTHKAVGVIASILSENNIQASCRTIHSFLGIKPFIDYETGEEKFAIDKTKKSKDSTSILIVDESSMISADLYEYILEAIEEGRVKMVLFVGDPYQLLPVNNSKNNIYDLENSFELNEVVRQAKDSYIIKLATKVRKRIENKNFMDIKKFLELNMEDQIKLFHNRDDFLEDFYSKKEWYKDIKVIASHKNKDVDAFNRTVRNKYWEQKGNNSPRTLLVGDMLRFVDAYSVKDTTIYHNGQEIEILEAIWKYHDTLEIEYWECKSVNHTNQQIFRVVDPDSMKVFNDKLSAIAKKAKVAKFPENKKLWKIFYNTRNMYANVQYIHSSTIHKLQGSTFDISYVDMFSLAHNDYMSLEEKYRLFYVAITRASKDIKIFISAFNQKIVNTNESNTYLPDVPQIHGQYDEDLKGIF